MSTDIENQLIELSCDNKLKQMFCETSLEIFWAHLCTGNHAELATKAISILLIFPTIYLCEKAFSTMANLKTSKRNRLETEDDLRIALSQIESKGGIYYVKTLKDNVHIKIFVSYFHFILYFHMNFIHFRLSFNNSTAKH